MNYKVTLELKCGTLLTTVLDGEMVDLLFEEFSNGTGTSKFMVKRKLAVFVGEIRAICVSEIV